MSDSNVFVNLRLDTSKFEAALREVRRVAEVTSDHVRAFGHAVAHMQEKPARCPRCHPRANPKPLCIDGAAYRRRTKGRKR